jgi:CRISPR-associated endonuclease Cas1 subtype II
MTWRIVEVSSSCKLELKLGYMVVRGEETRKVHLSEIAVVILDSTAISLTAALLCELTKRKIKVIFCDEKRLPYGELLPYFGSVDSTDRLRRQMDWKPESKARIWEEIVRQKIMCQADLLAKEGHEESAGMLRGYAGDIRKKDCTNREGFAAKVYFNALFGPSFSRQEDCPVNSRLNYGYTILMSAFSREISIGGYDARIGIFHDNTFNRFNLASDLMEPFRPLVDQCVLGMRGPSFDAEDKQRLIGVLNGTVEIDGKRNYVINAIRIYVQSFFDAMENNDPKRLKRYGEAEVHEGDGVLRPSDQDE